MIKPGPFLSLPDEYHTLKAPSEGLYKEKGSRFVAIAIPVESSEEIKHHLDRLRKTYHDARHHCYAYRLGEGAGETRFNDDGEPSGTAGKPIFGQIQSFNLTNVLLVVIRYFGGVKLGTGGLIQAYKTAAREAILQGEIISKTWKDMVTVNFSFEQMNDVMHIVKEAGLQPVSQNFQLQCQMVLEIRRSKAEIVLKKLSNLEKVSWQVI